MFTNSKTHYAEIIEQIKSDGLFKSERVITSPQSANIEVKGGQKVLNMCANNYLGLSNNPEIIKAAKDSFDKWGYGLSSVRFICGTQEIHKELEQKLSEFLGWMIQFSIHPASMRMVDYLKQFLQPMMLSLVMN